jgi:hypothetical protein
MYIHPNILPSPQCVILCLYLLYQIALGDQIAATTEPASQMQPVDVMWALLGHHVICAILSMLDIPCVNVCCLPLSILLINGHY